MSSSSTFMDLVLWTQDSDPYDHNQLVSNWNKVDQHRHLPGEGRQIPSGGIADSAITNAKLAPGAVTSDKIASNTFNIADGSITGAKIAAQTISYDKLTVPAVGSGQLYDGSVTNTKIAAGSVTSDKLASSVSLSVPRGTTIPSNPVEGQEYVYVVNLALGIEWHVKYTTYNGVWRFIGGAPITARVDTYESSNCHTAYGNWLATAGPTVYVPRTGNYSVECGAWLNWAGSSPEGTWISYGFNTAAAGDYQGTKAPGLTMQNRTQPLIYGVTAGTGFQCQYRNNSDDPAWGAQLAAQFRWIRATPIWIQ